MKWFDAGVNILDARLDASKVVESAVNSGVDKLCVITSQPDEWAQAEALYQLFPHNICYTVGIHPHCAKIATSAHWQLLKEAAQHPGVVAIGECGLDFNRDFSPRAKQIEVFEQQLAIASELNKPVYLHERDAFDQQMSSLNLFQGQLNKFGIAHCFTGTLAQMQAYLSLGLYIGITGWVCDSKRGQQLRQAIEHLPLDKLIVETDAPYLFPKTLRPRQRNNLPEYLPHIGQEIANIMQISTFTVSQVSYANTCKVFGLNNSV